MKRTILACVLALAAAPAFADAVMRVSNPLPTVTTDVVQTREFEYRQKTTVDGFCVTTEASKVRGGETIWTRTHKSCGPNAVPAYLIPQAPALGPLGERK